MELHIGIFSIAFITLTNAIIIPHSTMLRYNYIARSKVSTIDTQLLMSQYEISMGIIVTMFDKDIVMRLENIRYNASAGAGINSSEEDIVEKRKRVLQLPVLIRDDINDHWIKFDKRDQPWSVKMKKDIVFMLDIDTKCIRTKINHTCVHRDHFGNNGCELIYKVIDYNKTDEGIDYLLNYYSDKLFSSSCQLVPDVESNLNMKYYSFKNPGGIHTVKNEIWAFQHANKIYIQNISWHSEYRMPYKTFVLNSTQHITFNSTEEISHNEVIDNFIKSDSISEFSENVEVYIYKVKKILESIVNYIQTMEIELSKVMEEYHDDIFLMIEYMKLMTEKDLLRIYDELSNMSNRIDDFQNIFSMVLPVVETKHAITTIRHLILNKLVDEESAIRMLVNMPKAAISGTSFFTPELKDLTTVDNGLSERLRYVATLAIASTVSTRVKNAQGLPNSVLDEYAANASGKFLISGFHKEVILLVNALSNMQTNNIIPILQSIIAGSGRNSRLSPHVRSIAMLSLLQELPFGDDRQDRLSPILMKIVKGKTENIEIRLMAVNILMQIAHVDKWSHLFSYMLIEKNEEIRGFFYSTLKTIAESRVEYFGDRVGFARKLMKDIPDFYKRKSPNKSILFDFIDSLKNYGFARNYVVMGDLNEYKFLTLIMKDSFTADGAIFNQETVYLHFRLRGNYDKFVNLDLYSLGKMKPEDLSIELIIFKKQMVTFAEYLKPSEFIQLITDEFIKLNGKSTSILRDFENYRKKLTFLSGISFVEYFSASKIMNIKAENIIADPENYSLDFMHKSIDNIKYGLNVYNPLTDTWHGIRRVQKVDVLFGTTFKIGIKLKTGEIGIDWIPMNNKSQTIGFRSTARTEAVIFGDENKKIFKEPCPICNIKEGLNRNRTNLTIWEYDDENTGLLYQFKIFDCEDDDIAVHTSHFKKIFKDRMKSLSWKNIYLAVQNLWAYITLLPGDLNCGIGFSVHKSNNYPVNHFKFRIAHFKPSLEDTKLSFDVMHDGASVKSWNMSVIKAKYSNTFYVIIKESSESVVCISYSRNFKNFEYIAKLEVIENESCRSSDSNFTVEMVSVVENDHIRDLKKEDETYNDCISSPEYSFATCVTKATVMGKSVLNISGDFDSPHGVWRDLYVFLKDVYEIKNNNDSQNNPGNVEVVIRYRLPQVEQLDMSFKGFSESYNINNVQLDYTNLPSILEPNSFFNFGNPLWMEECEIQNGKLTLESGTVRKFNDSNDWKLVLGDCYGSSSNYSDCLWSICVRALNTDSKIISLRIITEEEELVYDFDGKVHIHTDDELTEVPTGEYNESESTEFMYTYENRSILIHMSGKSTVVGFNGKSVKLASNMENLSGPCNKRNDIPSIL